MNLLLFDDPALHKNLLPFTFLRPVAEIRIGILTIREKWEMYLQTQASFFVAEPYLSEKFQAVGGKENLFINGAVCPNFELLAAIEKLHFGEKLVQDDLTIAVKTKDNNWQDKYLQTVIFPGNLTAIRQLTDIFVKNGEQIKNDFKEITKGRESQPITDPFTKVYHPENIFLEEGVQIFASVLNPQAGPIYLGKNTIIQENSVIRGSFALLEGSQLNIGSKMRGDITIGPGCKVGGEVSNTVFFGNSNKGHDGFIGNAVVGEWCNLGADTNSSNMKNDYGNVKIWNYALNDYKDTGRQFCGAMIGDHSKLSIGTMLNTGTVIGINCNVFGSGFPPKYIPSFSWGGGDVFENYEIEKAIQVAKRMIERRNMDFSAADEKILRYLYQRKLKNQP
jgi:UDP-N-acetylglucosamine diphosphorylase/glucosamine-1-phosphate N-acetyltransferase